MSDNVDPGSWARYELRVVQAKSELSLVFCDWDPLAEEAETLCRQLAEELGKVRRDVNISRITGSGVSLGIGLPLIIAGIITTPMTFGASSILIGVGAGVSATGGLVAGGASLTEFGIRKTRMKEFKATNERLQELTRALVEAKYKLKAILLESLKFYQEPGCFKSGDESKDTIFAATEASRMALSAGGVALRIALENGDDVFKLIFAGSEVGKALGTTAARVALNSTFAAAAAVIDIYTIIDSAVNMAKNGNKYEAINKLESTASTLAQLRIDAQALIRRADGVIRHDAKNILCVAQDAFRCCVCLEVSRSPMIQCPRKECRSLLGCLPCLDQWVVNRGTCPKCRGGWPTRGTTNEQYVHGCDELLDQLRVFEDEK